MTDSRGPPGATFTYGGGALGRDVSGVMVIAGGDCTPVGDSLLKGEAGKASGESLLESGLRVGETEDLIPFSLGDLRSLSFVSSVDDDEDERNDLKNANPFGFDPDEG